MTEYFPDENDEDDATFIVSSFKILRYSGWEQTRARGGGGASKLALALKRPLFSVTLETSRVSY